MAEVVVIRKRDDKVVQTTLCLLHIALRNIHLSTRLILFYENFELARKIHGDNCVVEKSLSRNFGMCSSLLLIRDLVPTLIDREKTFIKNTTKKEIRIHLRSP